MFGRQHDVTGSTSRSADDFAAFFAKKIDDIRNDTAGLPPPVISRAPSSLTSFHQYTEAEVRRIVMKSPIKSCSLDPAPTFFLHEFIDLLLPYATRIIVNASPAQGRLPLSQRHAIATPLLKKPGQDGSDMSNYRPVSNLSFMSEVVERVVAEQLNEYLLTNDLIPRY